MATETSRETWSKRLDFLLTSIGWCVGLSNVWRFPYLCFKNGGGAFLIPYLLTFALCGIPILTLEYSMGQYAGTSIINIWDIAPLFKGIGIGLFIINLLIGLYYIFVVALSMRFLVASFTTQLPWASCDNYWNTDSCFMELATPSNASAASNMTTAINGSNAEVMIEADMDLPMNLSAPIQNFSSPTQEYFSNRILGLSSSMWDIGTPNWELVLCLAVAWILIFLTTIKGIKTSGKVVYFTATFPYVILTCLVVRGATLPGSLQGIKYYLIPDWGKLANPTVWFSAASQLFFSLGPGQGCALNLASYHKFNNNCVRDAVLVCFINSATSVFAGFAVFSVLGYLSLIMGQSVEDVVESGPGLAFVVYPQALSTMPAATFWSIAFFFVLILLGIDSELVHMETVISCIQDVFPAFRSLKKRLLLVALIFSSLFLIGIIFTTNAGFYYFQLFDWYVCSVSLFIVALMECMLFAWIYGVDKINENFKEMFGFGANLYFRICWKFIVPLFVMVILCFTIVTWSPITLGSYEYPVIGRIIGWSMATGSILPILVVAIVKLVASKETSVLKKISHLMKPTAEFRAHVQERIKQSQSFQDKEMENLKSDNIA